MKRIWFTLAALAGLVLLTWLFPLFHFIPIERAAASRAHANFNPSEFVKDFWSRRLMKSLDQATKADQLLPLIQSDPAAAKRRHSRSLGLSDSYTYFIAGSGRVFTISDKQILLTVGEGASQAQVALEVGLLFGNAVRDGTGLLSVSDFPNSRDFNAISEELNGMIEKQVLPDLRAKAKVGATVRFVGCAEIIDPATDLHPLRIVPIQAEVQ